MTSATLWKAILNELTIAYATFDADLRLVECDVALAAWLSDEPQNLKGARLLDVFPEFFGQELELVDVCGGDAAPIQIEHVNRTMTDDSSRYFTLTALACPQTGGDGVADDDVVFAVVVSDVSAQGEHLQALTQSRNELRLLRRRLSQLNAQLDFLLKHYLSPDIADALIAGELRTELGGEMREVTILFADARDYTAIAEKLPADRVMAIINDYLGVIVDAIDAHGGTVNQFQGDSVMAIFNAHNDQPDHAIRAVNAGIDLQKAVLAHQAQRPRDERWFHFGVGINSGQAIVGNSGARWRYTYTAIGDTTNLAARITSAVPAYEVWISEMTQSQLDGTFGVAALSPVQFKGKHQRTQLYRVLSDIDGHLLSTDLHRK